MRALTIVCLRNRSLASSNQAGHLILPLDTPPEYLLAVTGGKRS